jgi:hypothetical protein
MPRAKRRPNGNLTNGTQLIGEALLTNPLTPKGVLSFFQPDFQHGLSPFAAMRAGRPWDGKIFKINLIYLLTNQIQLSIFNYVIETNHTNKGVHHG